MRTKTSRLGGGFALAWLALCIPAFGGSPVPASVPNDLHSPTVAAPTISRAGETGVASYYGVPYDGQPTASGEIFDMNQFTAAHPRLAFGTRVRVTHLGNRRSVVVRVNDRGPFVKGRVIDLSQAAARELQMLASGVAEVKLEILN